MLTQHLKEAKHGNLRRYFEGQKDAFDQVLIELKNLKYELETTIEDEGDEEEQNEALPEENSGENLLKKALEKGVIIRRTSYYLHEDLPNGKAHGKVKMLQALNDRSFCKKIQSQIAISDDAP